MLSVNPCKSFKRKRCYLRLKATGIVNKRTFLLAVRKILLISLRDQRLIPKIAGILAIVQIVCFRILINT